MGVSDRKYVYTTTDFSRFLIISDEVNTNSGFVDFWTCEYFFNYVYLYPM